MSEFKPKLNFPLASSLPKTSAAKPSILNIVAQLMDDPNVEAKVARYTHDGIVTGSSMFDRAEAAQIVIDADLGGSLKRMGPEVKWRVALAISTVQRRTYDLRKGKVVGINAKTQALMLEHAQSAAMPPEGDPAAA
jgi:hypothetical protein